MLTQTSMNGAWPSPSGPDLTVSKTKWLQANVPVPQREVNVLGSPGVRIQRRVMLVPLVHVATSGVDLPNFHQYE